MRVLEMKLICNKCDKELVETSIGAGYLGIERAAPVLQCPNCKTAFVEKYVAVSLKAAEELLEKKRA